MPATYRLTYDRRDNAAELAAILAEDATPEELESFDPYQYAEEMGDCEECRRMLENCECGSDDGYPYWNEIEGKWEY